MLLPDGKLFKINERYWVYIIQNMLDQIDKNAVMILINALTLAAKWQSEFDIANTGRDNFYLPDGTEKGTRPVTRTQANISLDALPVCWTGKMISKSSALRKFVFSRSYQLRHVNGLTFDFLYDMAKTLAEKKALMLIGGGEKGTEPLVMFNGGVAYRAFLEGRIDGNKYMLIMHLTNLELKELPNA